MYPEKLALVSSESVHKYRCSESISKLDQIFFAPIGVKIGTFPFWPTPSQTAKFELDRPTHFQVSKKSDCVLVYRGTRGGIRALRALSARYARLTDPLLRTKL